MMLILGTCLALANTPQPESFFDLQANSQQVDAINPADQFFADTLASHYMRIICPGGGNCFYHAVAQGLGCEMMNIRQTLRTYLEENHASLEQLNDDVLMELFLESEFEALLESIGNAATGVEGLGGLPHAKLAAWAYEVPVAIFSHLFPEAPIIFDTDMYGNPLQGNLIELFYDGGHWDRLVPTK